MSSSNENLGPDPSMEEILSSIRRILKEDERVPLAGAPAPMAHAPEAAQPKAVQPKAAQPEAVGQTEAVKPPEDDEVNSVLVLDPSMMVPEAAASKPPVQSQPPAQPPPPLPRPVAPARASVRKPDSLLGESAAETASSHLESLMRTLPHDRAAGVSRGGPTLEDVVRDELRPLLRAWLDNNLPPLVERIVRAEIERLVARINS
jgi:cell pole-organizing protein PopZ